MDFFRKVRGIIENEKGEFIISQEGGKYIFPGGKCEKDEDELIAIKREISEETGIVFKTSDFHKILEIETIYDDYYDYRTNLIKPRHTITTYYYVKTNKNIDKQKVNLTECERRQNFKVLFVNKDTLLSILTEDHSTLENGRFFDEENRIIIDEILRKEELQIWNIV